MQKVISVVLAMVMCMVLSGCADTTQASVKLKDSRDKIIGDLVFQIPNEAEENFLEYGDNNQNQFYTFINYDSNSTPLYRIEVVTCDGEDAKTAYNNDVKIYSDINAFNAQSETSYPEYITTVEELPKINGAEYQVGSCWTMSIEGQSNRLHILSCIIDDTYYTLTYTGIESNYDPDFWNDFISSIKKL